MGPEGIQYARKIGYRPRKLTAKERAWVDEAQALFDRMPKTFHLLTQGDYKFQLIDAKWAEDSEAPLHDGHPSEVGASLGAIECPCPVHGVAG